MTGTYQIKHKPYTLALVVLVLVLFLIQPALADDNSPAEPQPKTLQILIFPFMYKAFTINWWKPFAAHLHQQTGLDVQPVVVDNYDAFLKAGADNNFDLFLLPDHMFVPFYQDYQRLPFAHITLSSTIVFITNAKNPVHSFNDLNNACISSPDPLSFTAMAGQQHLLKAGLVAGKDFTFAHAVSHSDVVLEVFRGTCPVGVMSEVLFRQAATNNRDILILKKYTLPKPSFGVSFFINPNVSATEQARLSESLLAFGSTPDTSVLLDRPLYFSIESFSPTSVKQLLASSLEYYPLLEPFLPLQDQ